MVPASDVVLIGHRTLDLDAARPRRWHGCRRDLRRIDAATVAVDPAGAGERAASWLADSGRGAWLHIDLDVLDPVSLPAVTYPQPNGLDWDQLAAVIEPLGRSPRLLGVSIADFRPDLDPTGEQGARIVGLLEQTLP